MSSPTPWQAHAVKNLDWQTSKSSVVERTKHLLKTGLYADCEFLVGGDDGSDQEIIKAHQYFLAMSSPVFDAMFFGKMIEGTATINQPISLPDLTPSSFKDLLQYIYTDSVDLQSMDQAISLCYAAKKYILPDLVAKCVQYMKDNLCTAYTFKVLEFSTLIDDEHLKARCLSLLRERTRESVGHSDFEDLSEWTLLSIMKEESLNIREVELFDAVVRWAKRQCTQRELEFNQENAREILDGIIPYIRFLTMKPEEFSFGPVLSEILTEKECMAVFVNFNIPNLGRESRWSLPAHLSLSRRERRASSRPIYETLNTYYCLRQIENDTESFIEPLVDYITTFTVDQNITLQGIFLAENDLSKLIKEEDDGVLICRLLDANGSLLGSAKKRIKAMSSAVWDPVLMQPVRVNRDSTYRIAVSTSQRAYFHLGKASPVVYSGGVEFKFSTNDVAKDGLVRGFLFSQ